MRDYPRLFLQGTSLREGQIIQLTPEHSYYLVKVMRLKNNFLLRLFNGQDGEWQAVILEADKKNARIQVQQQLLPQTTIPEVHLYFALIKPDPLRYLIEKATELNVTYFHPLLTERTVIRDLNLEKTRRYTIEASEQCERLSVPQITPLQTFSDWLETASHFPHLLMADERRAGQYLPSYAPYLHAPLHLLVGPEGGFSEAEFTLLKPCKNVRGIKLAPTILRAETAAITFLAQLQPYINTP